MSDTLDFAVLTQIQQASATRLEALRQKSLVHVLKEQEELEQLALERRLANMAPMLEKAEKKQDYMY